MMTKIEDIFPSVSTVSTAKLIFICVGNGQFEVLGVGLAAQRNEYTVQNVRMRGIISLR